MFFHTVHKSGQIFLPFCHNPRVWQTDRRTERILLAIPRLHYMQRGKKHSFLSSMKLSKRLGPTADPRPKKNEFSAFKRQIMLLAEMFVVNW